MIDAIQRQAIIYSLIDRLNKHGWTGKTQVQKVVFFAQEAAGLDLGFRYVIHHYGPYSFELNSFMQVLDARGILKVAREEDGYGFNVSRGEIEGGSVEDDVARRKLDALEQYLGSVSTSDLELLSTCWYIARRFPESQRADLVKAVRALKPRFSESQVERALDESREIASALQAA